MDDFSEMQARFEKMLKGLDGNGTTQATTLSRDLIRKDGGTQLREKMDEETVARYAELMRGGVKLPAVVVFHDGEHYWLAEGFHRDAAAGRAGRTEIEADVRRGTLRDAI